MSSHDWISLLATQTWQVAAVAGVVWLLSRVACKERPKVAHALWALVLLKVLTPPLWSSPLSPFSWSDRIWGSAPIEAKQVGRLETFQESTKGWSSTLKHIEIRWDRTDHLQNAASKSVASTWPKQIAPKISQARFWSWTTGFLVVWIAGSVASLLIALFRIARFWRWVRLQQKPLQQENFHPMHPQKGDGPRTSSSLQFSEVFSADELEQTIRRLEKELRVGRRTRLLVVEAAIGPAVFGILRPTIILPRLLLEGRSIRDIEPLVAHELIHIRRGDLWWALVQTLATSFLWFHPLVRLAGRMLTLESERSCDEETIRGLGCTAATYARSLLDVLECKHQLRVAPALPGVRPVDITRNRLERIMKMRHGSRPKHRSWMAIATLLLGALTLLPGASLSWGQEKSSKQKQEKAESPGQPIPGKVYPQPFPVLPRPQALPPKLNVQTSFKKYDVSDLLTRIKGLKVGESAEQFLIGHLEGVRYWSNGPIKTKFGVEVADSKHGIIRLGMKDLPIKLIDNELCVAGTDEHQKKIEAALASFRKHGFSQVCVSLKYINVPTAWIQDRSIAWLPADPVDETSFLRQVETDQDAFPIAVDPKPMQASPNSVTFAPGGTASSDKGLSGKVVLASNPIELIEVPCVAEPTFYSILSEEQTKALVERAQQNPFADILQAPKVTMFPGQTASVSDTRWIPFVVRAQPIKNEEGKVAGYQPVVATAKAGNEISVQPNLCLDSSTDLSLRLTLHDVSKVKTLSFGGEKENLEKGEGAPENTPLTIQSPDLLHKSLSLQTKIPVGSSVVIGSAVSDKDKSAMIVLVTCQIIDEKDIYAPPQSEETAYTLKQDAPDGPLRAVVVDEKPETKLVISTEKKNQGRNYNALLEALKKMDHPVEIDGDVEFNMESTPYVLNAIRATISLKGDKESDEMTLYGDSASLSFAPNNFEAKFEGNVQFKWGNFRALADRLQSFQPSGVLFQGNVRLKVETEKAKTVMIVGDSIRWDQGSQFEIVGNGALQCTMLDDGSKVEHRANRIWWNADTFDLRSTP